MAIFSAVPILVSMFFVLGFVEERKGLVLSDFVLNGLPSVDLSVSIFGLMYLQVFVGSVYIIKNPRWTLRLAQAYLLMLTFRMICMLVVPLEPPEGIIPLRDYILERSFYNENVNLKDLFFSGHTATVFLFYLAIKAKYLRLLFFFGGIIIGFALLMQHAHYTIDVLFAPVFAWLSFFIAGKLQPQSSHNSRLS